MEEWDPIGVKGIPEAADEYDRYIADVIELLRRDASEEEIFKYLSAVEAREMEMSMPDSKARAKTASSLQNLPVHQK